MRAHTITTRASPHLTNQGLLQTTTRRENLQLLSWGMCVVGLAVFLLTLTAAAATLGDTYIMSAIPSPSSWMFNDAFPCSSSTGGAPAGWPVVSFSGSANVSGWLPGRTPFAVAPLAQQAHGTALYAALNSSSPVTPRAQTAYFQSTFQLGAEAVARILSASLSFAVGDGAVVFVNGMEGAMSALLADYQLCMSCRRVSL